MKISSLPSLLSPELAANHGSLSSIELEFIRHVERHPECVNPIELPTTGHAKLVQQYEFALQPLPLFMQQSVANAFGQVAVELFDIYRRLVVQLATDQPQLLAPYFSSDCDLSLQQLFKSAHGLDDCLLRADFCKTKDGLQLLEFNVSGNIGGWQIFLFEPIYRQQPALEAFMAAQSVTFTTHQPLQAQVMHCIEVTQRHLTEQKVPHIVVWMGFAPERADESRDLNARAQAQLAAAGIHVEFSVVVSVAEFSLHEDGAIFVGGRQADSLLLLDRTKVLPEFVLEKNRRGEFPIFDSQAAEILSQKSGIALLSEYAEWPQCPIEHKQLIEQHVPWTRFVQPGKVKFAGQEYDLETLVGQEKNHFVLKVIDGSQGVDVHVGKKMSQQDWIDVVKKSFTSKNYIVQAYCESEKLLAVDKTGQLAEHDAIWAPFVFGGKFAGNYLRLAPSNNETGVINAHRGAADVMIFLHD